PQHFDRDRGVRIKVVRAVEIDRIQVVPRNKLLEIDHLRAFDIERLQFLGGERDELAATVFVSFHDLAFVDLLAGSGIMRPKRDPSGGPTLVRSGLPFSAGSRGADDAEPCCAALRSGNSSSVTSTRAGCRTWCKRIGFVCVVAGDI